MKAKTVRFSSLMFLKATPKELIRKRRLKDRLLMAARMAILALLALAFARPFVPSEEIPFIPQRESESVVILLDRSFSMRQENAFAEAVERVRDRLNAARPGDEAALISFADDVQMLAPLETDITVHVAALESAAAGYRSTDYFPALQRARDLLQEARHDRRVVVLVSDFQDSGWSGSLDNFDLGEGIVLETLPVATGSGGNAFVEDFGLDRRRVEGRYAARYDARIAYVAGNPATPRTPRVERESERESEREHQRENERESKREGDVESARRTEGENEYESASVVATEAQDASGFDRSAALVVDGVEVSRQTLAPRASAPVSFQHRLERDGYYQGSIVIDAPRRGNALADDDVFYFTDRADALPGILIIDAPSALSRPDAFFLRSAFDLGEQSRFVVSTADEPGPSALIGQNVVFLANRATGERDRAELRRYVERGGTLVVSAGDDVDPADLSRTLAALELGRIDAIVNTREEQGYEAIVGEFDRRHPIFEPFAAEGRAGAILRPKFRRYARLIPGEQTIVVGRFDSGDPFLAERRLGSGRVLFYASTFNTSWTDLPLDEMYVPFVYQIAGYGAGGSDESHLFHVGDVIPLSGSRGGMVEVRAPQGRLHRVSLDENGQGYFRDTDVPGHYAASNGSSSRFFSVNVDPEESNLRRRDAEEVYAAVVTPSQDVATTPQEAAAAVIESDERQQKLWRIVLLLVLALFVLETYFANRSSPSVEKRDIANRMRSSRAGGDGASRSAEFSGGSNERRVGRGLSLRN